MSRRNGGNTRDARGGMAAAAPLHQAALKRQGVTHTKMTNDTAAMTGRRPLPYNRERFYCSVGAMAQLLRRMRRCPLAARRRAQFRGARHRNIRAAPLDPEPNRIQIARGDARTEPHSRDRPPSHFLLTVCPLLVHEYAIQSYRASRAPWRGSARRMASTGP